MKKLLSLPPNLVHNFHKLKQLNAGEWYCTSDPVDKKLGSGGGTTWLLESCRQSEAPQLSMQQWLQNEKKILLHAGGQSRRLPAYAPSGKILTPIPVFRWARGQRLDQDLLSLQIPLYERILQKAPDSFHTLIASGDVYIRTDEPLPYIPDVDVVCFGLWVDPLLATRHGVFVSSRQHPDSLDFMLQKPSVEQLSKLAGTHFFLMDIGVWLLNDRAVELLIKRSRNDRKEIKKYDLYGEFGLSLGDNPVIEDKELNGLSVAILPLPGGEFYHFGTTPELISSTMAIQNLVHDQRSIMHQKIKPHPAMFVQNSIMNKKLSSLNSYVWIENSFIGKSWILNDHHILTGIPQNDWNITIPSGICIDIVPVEEKSRAVRPYGFYDTFSGKISVSSTCFLGIPFFEWQERRGLSFPIDMDIQQLPLFPVCETVKEIEELLQWMISDPGHSKGKNIWMNAVKLSADEICRQANLERLTEQRISYRTSDLPVLAANHECSIFYQLDLSVVAAEFASFPIPLPPSLPENSPLMKKIHDQMFRSRVHQLKGECERTNQEEAFRLLQEEITKTIRDRCQIPRLCVHPDQIVWGRSPVRIDLAGGWTDTPPYCLYSGGNVINVAIEINSQPPLQVYIKPSKEYAIVLRSIDQGATEKITSWNDLLDFMRIGSPFSIPKTALALAGFTPDFSKERYSSLESQLKVFGSGIEITLLSAVPAGSGLGTSSILAATLLGALSDFCGLNWDKNEIGNRTLVLEQLLTSGGGWQDQYGGILHGVKFLQTHEGIEQQPLVRWLPEQLFTDPQYHACHLLYYTGITRTAKNILSEIVQAMFLNSASHLSILEEMKKHTLDMYEAIQRNDFREYGFLIGKTWEQNKALDTGTNPPAIEQIISLIKDYTYGYKLPGAGGGGYLYIIAKDPEAAVIIRTILSDTSPNLSARFVDMKLSTTGMQISRS